MKLIEIQNLNNALIAISSARFNIKTAFAISRNKQLMQPIIESIETQRLALLKDLGEKDEKGELKSSDTNGNAILSVENHTKFQQQITELLLMDHDITLLKIPVEDLTAVNLEISSQNMEFLYPILSYPDIELVPDSLKVSFNTAKPATPVVVNEPSIDTPVAADPAAWPTEEPIREVAGEIV